jgi:hypothetical protein
MRVSALAAALLVALNPVLAVDHRELFSHPASDPTKFCNAWRCAW